MLQHRFSSIGFYLAVAVTAFGLVPYGSRADAQVVATANGTWSPLGPDGDPLVADGGTGTIPYELTQGGNAIVVGLYQDNTWTPTTVSIGAQAADGIVSDQRASLIYFFNPPTTGDITFDIPGNSPDGAYFLMELFDVDTGAAVDTGTGNMITTTAEGRFVVSFIGANNTDGSDIVPGAGSILSISGVGNARGAIGGGSVGAGFADARFSGAAGAKNVSFTGLTGGFAQGQISAAFTAPPILIDLVLVVNKDTGEIKIRNETDAAVSFDYYSISSAGNALRPTGVNTWNSLDEQNIDAGLVHDLDGSGSVDGGDIGNWESSTGLNAGGDVNADGTSNGRDVLSILRNFGDVETPADGWIEAGGSTVGKIGELFIDGLTTLGPDEEVSLGFAYNTSVFGAADGDLLFEASPGESTQLLGGFVRYENNAAVAVPEPGSLLLCLLGSLGAFGRRYCRS